MSVARRRNGGSAVDADSMLQMDNAAIKAIKLRTVFCMCSFLLGKTRDYTSADSIIVATEQPPINPRPGKGESAFRTLRTILPLPAAPRSYHVRWRSEADGTLRAATRLDRPGRAVTRRRRSVERCQGSGRRAARSRPADCAPGNRPNRFPSRAIQRVA